ncbi:hypothetical protein Dalk_2881 [Desulfatibacillum aliphaticivorans]|uniref:Uncharacterized protein n=1 Tax=Desulfatibacillum aliphaticivorans TaxID=218208 RepID=B8FBC7_DESAL|nr:hypothetical protein Dalk_2881 [Desulfatibacillum aliphaticivorans]
MSLAFKTAMLTTEGTENTEFDYSVTSVCSVVHVFCFSYFSWFMFPMVHAFRIRSHVARGNAYLRLILLRTFPTGIGNKTDSLRAGENQNFIFQAPLWGLANQLNYCFFPSPPSVFRVFDFLTDVPESPTVKLLLFPIVPISLSSY